MARKLDMSKARARHIVWCFLEAIMLKFGFDVYWVARVMECVKTVSVLVLINGNPTEEFAPGEVLDKVTLSRHTYSFCV